MLGPLSPRPEPLLMSTRGVNQPAGSDAGKCDWAGRPSGGVSCLIRRCGICERAGRGRDTRPTPAAALRGQHPQREQGEEDHQSDRGTVTVKRGHSLLGRVGPATVAGKLTVGSIGRRSAAGVTECVSRLTAKRRSSRLRGGPVTHRVGGSYRPSLEGSHALFLDTLRPG